MSPFNFSGKIVCKLTPIIMAVNSTVKITVLKIRNVTYWTTWTRYYAPNPDVAQLHRGSMTHRMHKITAKRVTVRIWGRSNLKRLYAFGRFSYVSYGTRRGKNVDWVIEVVRNIEFFDLPRIIRGFRAGRQVEYRQQAVFFFLKKSSSVPAQSIRTRHRTPDSLLNTFAFRQISSYGYDSVAVGIGSRTKFDPLRFVRSIRTHTSHYTHHITSRPFPFRATPPEEKKIKKMCSFADDKTLCVIF